MIIILQVTIFMHTSRPPPAYHQTKHKTQQNQQNCIILQVTIFSFLFSSQDFDYTCMSPQTYFFAQFLLFIAL